jgi:hypothetical protein
MLRDGVYERKREGEKEGRYGLEFCEDSAGNGYDRDKMEINALRIYLNA